MKLYSSFNQLSLSHNVFEEYFKENTQYYAHTHNTKPYETLYKHTELVKNQFNQLIKIQKLEPIIDNIISTISFKNKDIGEYLKLLFLNSIVFHDSGKLNPNFQSVQMNNNAFVFDKKIKIGTQHSFLSAYAFISFHLNHIVSSCSKRESIELLMPFVFIFSIPIIKHHSGYIEKDYDFDKDTIKSIHHLVNLYDLQFPFENLLMCFEAEKAIEGQSIWNAFNEKVKKEGYDYFALFTLLKLNYSLLTASDYYATSEYMNDVKLSSETDFGLITTELKQRIFNYFDANEKAPYNGELIKNTQKYLSTNIDELQEKKNDNLNLLRQRLGAEVLSNIEKYKGKNIFYIEAPTGGGKTNMSMIAVRKMMELHPEINKVFYVFPFTTLITQTTKAIKDTLGLKDHEIAQVHSKAGFQTKESNNNGETNYGKNYRNQIDNLFNNYPFTLLTHIKFFDILKSNKKDTNYILHRFANSIVIIDELQSYNPSEWDKVMYYISQYAQLFNIRFIIMSATLPKIDGIRIPDFQTIAYQNLIANSKQYLRNPNFAERVTFKYDLLSNDEIELQELANILFEKSETYANTRNDVFNGSVYTIIEFIYKKSASEFYKIITDQNVFFDEVFVLSGTIIEPRRKYIIDFLKDSNNRNKKILLITTQVVEAGVDIDMDLGFKNQSLIDSDEQLAGRINRNVNKKNCELWLFKHDKPKTIYGKDLRYKVTQDFEPSFIEEILTKKDFNKLYERVFEDIKKNNDNILQIGTLPEYLNLFNVLNFRKINEEFKLIDSDNVSIFVPVDIPVECYGTEKNFSDSEINFLQKHNCFFDEKNAVVLGEKVWEVYIYYIHNKELNFSVQKMQLLILNGIMSKFVFSVFMKKQEQLREFLDYNEIDSNYRFYQYFKLLKSAIGKYELYSLDSGINEDKLNDGCEFI